ncbi:hypothetical protein E4P40_17530 [Blastococcus sp. CT_GayMR20]|uniref:hypothetical protein n=1 Tax=Blastococcus sp. CT_GayMR20 TaxID=2559609 RepID=UPI0010743F7C|nr:hypothetical protein [Blastococcus sp. CT_GayMR20]TFV80803.1 hypothetical protein E4P40_17530 [Blastococcus sp. CT_GayMR20]
MDDDFRDWLFDPPTAHRLVLAHRPARATAVTCVVSDVVWQEVVGLLRWATASTGGVHGLESGRWWRLAAACADLLRRLPAFGDELGRPWRPAVPIPEQALAGTERVAQVTGRLAALLRSADPLPLARLAVEIDELGAAAISAYADEASWTVPGTTS